VRSFAKIFSADIQARFHEFESWLRSHVGTQAPINIDDTVVCIFVGGEEDCGFGYFRWIAESSEGNLLDQGLLFGVTEAWTCVR
jgi:hypothetical protein